MAQLNDTNVAGELEVSGSLGTNLIKLLGNIVYPVGSILMNITGENPSEIWGGTWSQWSVGRVPIGVYPSEPEFAEADMNGGNRFITLGNQNIPPHTHEIPNYRTGQTDNTADGGMYCISANTVWAYSQQGEEAQTKATNNSTGTAQAIDITYRYTTCYFWKRDA